MPYCVPHSNCVVDSWFTKTQVKTSETEDSSGVIDLEEKEKVHSSFIQYVGISPTPDSYIS